MTPKIKNISLTADNGDDDFIDEESGEMPEALEENRAPDLEYLRFAAKYKSPYPYFGSKALVADLVWERLGNVNAFYEPFFGAGHVTFRRPHAPKIEIINDLDCFIANFWRAIKWDKAGVLESCDEPINATNLHARHRWMVEQKEFIHKMRHDTFFYDSLIAGWWVWGISQWIGGEFCKDIPIDKISTKRPHLTSWHGIHRERAKGEGALEKYIDLLSWRLRLTKVCCGNWYTILNHKLLAKYGSCGIFLDPPYSHDLRVRTLYAEENSDVAQETRKWAIENGNKKHLRIVLAGYAGEHEMPENWTSVNWKAGAGYGSQGEGRGVENRTKEILWFSPYCLNAKQGALF